MSRFSVVSKRMLSEGNAIQVVMDRDDGRKAIEIVSSYGSELATDDGEECVRIPGVTAADAEAICEAIDEVTGEAPPLGPKSREDYARDAVELLAMAEGAAAVAARADFGTPEELTAARVMIFLARGLICGVFKLTDPGPQFPEDA